MKMEKYLVTQGLNELKMLDSRILREINNGLFVSAAKKSEKNVNSYITKEEFNRCAKSSLQAITDLIERRNKIKSAIVESNSNTLVTVGGKEFTVADVIERKNSISYESGLLNAMKSQFLSANKKVDLENSKVEEAIERLVTTAFGKDSKNNIKEDDYNTIAKPYKDANEFAIVDPIGIEKQIKSREEEIETFISTCDSVLQISNCTTWIEF